MPARVLDTDGSATPITLSVNEVHPHHITTIINIDGTQLNPIQGDFFDLVIGNNTSLAGKTITVTTVSLKSSPSNDTETDYSFKGCGGAANQVDDADPLTFDAGSNQQTHTMIYDLI